MITATLCFILCLCSLCHGAGYSRQAADWRKEYDEWPTPARPLLLESAEESEQLARGCRAWALVWSALTVLALVVWLLP